MYIVAVYRTGPVVPLLVIGGRSNTPAINIIIVFNFKKCRTVIKKLFYFFFDFCTKNEEKNYTLFIVLSVLLILLIIGSVLEFYQLIDRKRLKEEKMKNLNKKKDISYYIKALIGT